MLLLIAAAAVHASGMDLTSSSALSAPTAFSVNVDPTNITHEVSPLIMGCHSDSGYTHQARGLYAQMIVGESFEGLSRTGILPTGRTVSLHSASFQFNVSEMLTFLGKGCSELQLYVAACSVAPAHRHGSACDGGQDFKVVPALSGQGGAVSFESYFLPGHFLAVGVNAKDPMRVWLERMDSNTTRDSASFEPVRGLGPSPGGVSLRSLSSNTAVSGGYLTVTANASGSCKPGNAKGNVEIVRDPEDKAAATWRIVDSPVSPGAWPRNPWSGFTSSQVNGTAVISDDGEAFHGHTSLSVKYYSSKSSDGLVGMANRGLGHEGLVFKAGKDYEGYFFAKSVAPVTFGVAILDYTHGNRTLASQTISFAGGGGWTRLNFSLAPNGSTNCEGIEPGSDPDVDCGGMGGGQGDGNGNGPNFKTDNVSHICVRCGGEFVVGLAAPGEAHIDYVYLQPGSWGRFSDLPVLASGVALLRDMGVTAIRQGGSFADDPMYAWKAWRGPAWNRTSLGAAWGDIGTLMSGWGPFEAADMCNAAGIEMVMTTYDGGVTESPCTPADFADLIEYCWGNISTAWGRMRIVDDKHPEPFRIKYFELGNEQYNQDFPAQVAAMEAKATALGMPNELFYLNPNNGNWLQPGDAAKIEKLGLHEHASMDIHTGDGGAIATSKKAFQKSPSYTMGSANAETNAGTHTMTRALSEAIDLNDWANCGGSQSSRGLNCSRLLFRTASFCSERSGHFSSWDQGISFFLPNMTWLQPPGLVHSLWASTWEPMGLHVTPTLQFVSSGDWSQKPLNESVGASAQSSRDGHTVIVRLTNTADTPIVAELHVPGFSGDNATNATSWTLQALMADGSPDKLAANPPGDPTRVHPVAAALAAGAEGFDQVALPAFAFVVVQYEKGASNGQ